jgi:pheromone shutdown-related protein TraB
MKTFRNLIILGTSHIAIESINKVRELIETEKPEIIALELDILRFKKLLSKKKQKIKLKDILTQGSFLNSMGALIEKKLGEKVGIMPGEEMLTAIKLAKKHKLQLALIDQPIQITFKRLKEKITFKEKLRFLTDILTSLVMPKKRIKIDLTKVPEAKLIKKIIRELKKRYPNVHKTLIQERNLFMTQQLLGLIKINKKTLVIVGAGHEDDLIRLLKCNLQKKK